MGAACNLAQGANNLCCLQNGHNEAPVNVHAFSSNSMPGGPPAFKGAQGGPETPDLDMPNGSHPQLSDSYDQVNIVLNSPQWVRNKH